MVRLIGKNLCQPTFKAFLKAEAAISELQAAFEILHAWLKRAQYCSIRTKYSAITAKAPDF